MSLRFIVIHSLWLLCTIAIIVCLLKWTSAAFDFGPQARVENFEKPYRAPFRLAFSGTVTVLLFGTQALVARRFPL